MANVVWGRYFTPTFPTLYLCSDCPDDRRNIRCVRVRQATLTHSCPLLTRVFPGNTLRAGSIICSHVPSVALTCGDARAAIGWTGVCWAVRAASIWQIITRETRWSTSVWYGSSWQCPCSTRCACQAITTITKRACGAHLISTWRTITSLFTWAWTRITIAICFTKPRPWISVIVTPIAPQIWTRWNQFRLGARVISTYSTILSCGTNRTSAINFHAYRNHENYHTQIRVHQTLSQTG